MLKLELLVTSLLVLFIINTKCNGTLRTWMENVKSTRLIIMNRGLSLLSIA